MEDIDISNIKNKKLINYFDKSFFYALLAIVIYYFVFNTFDIVLLSAIRPLLNNNIPGVQSFFSALFNFIIYISIAIPLFFIYKKELINDHKRIKDTSHFILYIIISIIIMFVANMFAAIIQNLIVKGSSENQQSIDEILSNNYAYLLMFPQVVLLAPFVEELIFRKSFFNLIKNKYLALAITTILFGGMHVTSTFQMLIQTHPFDYSFGMTLAYGIPYFTMGFVFGMIYLKSDKNIYASIACHLFNNFLASATMLIFMFIH